jgi:hypothetical protein
VVLLALLSPSASFLLFVLILILVDNETLPDSASLLLVVFPFL